MVVLMALAWKRWAMVAAVVIATGAEVLAEEPVALDPTLAYS